MIHFAGLALLVFFAACGDRSNLRLEVVPGQSRSKAESALRDTKYCRVEPREQRQQSYGRCGVKGFELGESQVLIEYDAEGSVARARRMERFEDDEQATRRWNALVGEREQAFGAESPEARTRLAALGEGPVGAVLWKAWFGKNLDQVIGVYLVRPSDPREPQIVEVIRWDRAGL